MYVRFPFTTTGGDSLVLDIDILVTPDGSENFDAEDIKRSIVDADSRQKLWPSKGPPRIMRCPSAVFPGFKKERRLVEFDILIPLRPRLRIPKVLSEDIWLINNIPVMPIL